MFKITKNPFPLEWKLSDNLKVPYHGKKVFGTFVCGGGSTMGYKLAGFEHLGGVEFTEHYSKVYKKNHKPKHFYTEDIREFNKRNDLPEELYNLDLLDGSPPCAAFSTAGAREKNWGKSKDYEGIKQIKDDLVYHYCETIEKLTPKVFLLENVSGLAKGNAKSYLKKIVARLSKGYKVQVFLLYAGSMGIPQIRNRVFIIGHKKEFNLPKLSMNFDIPNTTFEICKKFENHKSNMQKQLNTEKQIQSWSEIKEGGTHKKNFSRVKTSYKKQCYTVTASACTGDIMHHKQKRYLNIEEIRLLCTFPKDYNFLDVKYNLMGRSVLPVMMAQISNQIYLQWLKNM